jgi:hypothetical protein
MSNMARLVCPLCEAVVSEGQPPVPGTCPSCHARYVGDAESAPAAVEQGLKDLSVEGLTPSEVANALFVVPSDRCRELGVSITSDERAGFYRWWLFISEGRGAREQLDDLLTESRK